MLGLHCFVLVPRVVLFLSRDVNGPTGTRTRPGRIQCDIGMAREWVGSCLGGLRLEEPEGLFAIGCDNTISSCAMNHTAQVRRLGIHGFDTQNVTMEYYDSPVKLVTVRIEYMNVVKPGRRSPGEKNIRWEENSMTRAGYQQRWQIYEHISYEMGVDCKVFPGTERIPNLGGYLVGSMRDSVALDSNLAIQNPT